MLTVQENSRTVTFLSVAAFHDLLLESLMFRAGACNRLAWSLFLPGAWELAGVAIIGPEHSLGGYATLPQSNPTSTLAVLGGVHMGSSVLCLSSLLFLDYASWMALTGVIPHIHVSHGGITARGIFIRAAAGGSLAWCLCTRSDSAAHLLMGTLAASAGALGQETSRLHVESALGQKSYPLLTSAAIGVPSCLLAMFMPCEGPTNFALGALVVISGCATAVARQACPRANAGGLDVIRHLITFILCTLGSADLVTSVLTGILALSLTFRVHRDGQIARDRIPASVPV